MTSRAKEVGYRIRKIREAQDLSQQDMANHLEITAGAYAKIERGETDPSITRLYEIAEVLNVDLFRLFKEPAEIISADVQTQISTLTKDMETLKKTVASLQKPI